MKKLLLTICMVLPVWFVLGQAPGGVTPAVWYKADAGVYSNAGTTAAADNATVQQWNDQMGTGYNLAQATAGQRPTFSNQSTLANFNPTVSFNADFMAADPGNGNAIINRIQGSIYITGKMNAIGAAGLAGFDASMDYPGLHTSQTSPNDKLLFYTAGSGYATNSTNSFTALKGFVAGSSWLNGGGTPVSNVLAKVWLDGNENIYNNTDGNVNAGNPTRIFRIGGDTNWGSLNGQLNETIVFANPLSASEKARVDSYLSVKWGTTLLSSYVNSTSTTVWNYDAAYQNNILGIGRDNNSALYQKQSRSENPNQKLIIGAGNSLANTNAANTNTLTDGQFLLVGDNGLKQTLTTPLAYTGGSNGDVNYRFEAIWKVENTGNVGTVTIAWPKGVNNLYLVQSGDAAFDGGDIFTPMATEVTINGVVYNTANVTLADGEFFTLAGYMYTPGGVVSAAWYRADAAVYSDFGTTSAADNAAVQQWNEFNGLGTNISQATLANRPVYSNSTTLTNFNPTVTFDGSNDILLYQPSTNGNINILDRSKGALFSAGNITGIATMAGFGPASDDPGLYSYSGTNNLLLYPRTGEYDAISTNSTAGHYIGGGTWENGAGVGSNNAVLLSLRGDHQVFNTNIQNVLLDATRNDLRVGGDTDYARLNGQQNEVIIFPNKLTDDEVTKVETYLAVKYGQTLSKVQSRNYVNATGVVIWDGTANNTYYNNVIGIGRENVSALHQKQSKSVNTDQKLIIGAGNSLADTNATNTNSLTDGQYLLVGDNGLKQSLTTPLSYTAGTNGAANYRFESIWKEQNTGSTGTVTVAWPKGIKNLYLVQSPNDVFGDGDDVFTPMTTEMTVNGVVYNTVNVTLGNGQYFTFAGFAHAPGGVATGLSYWYRADVDAANTGVGTDVTAWKDVWNGTTVAQLGTNALPKYVQGAVNYFNFNPGINFTANTQTLGNNTVRTLTSLNYDVFTFTKEGTTHSGGNPRIFSTGMDNTTTGSVNWDGFGIWPAPFTALERRPYGGGTQFPNVNPAFDTSIPSIMYFRNTNTATSKGLNGAGMATSTAFSAVGSMFGGHVFGDTRFSSNGSDNAGFMGHIGETIVYGAGTLSNTERRKVDSYLAIKYGITLGQVNTDHYLDADGALVWNGGTNASYNNNVFGVAREDIGLFEQKVSKSVNTGTILTLATINNFVNPNLDASRTGFANDKTYFILGDNNVTATPLNNITVAGSTLKRIQRAWLSQRKNTPDVLYFGADLSAYPATSFGSATNTVWMLVADDAAFTTNVKMVAGTYTSGKWVFANNFNSDNTQRYITFAEGKIFCYKPGITVGTALNTKVGITALSRAGADNSDNWPMTRKGGWLVLEAKTKAFVPNRVSFSAGDPVGIAPANFAEGMMVYDATNKCMKIYTQKEGDASPAWHCITTQTCPD